MNSIIKAQTKQLGLALSGGGQRAAAFHLGVLKKLEELGILDQIDKISSISGGSIIAGFYALYRDHFDKFYSEFISKLSVNLELRILFARDFIWKLILVILLVGALLFSFFSFNNYLFLVLLIPVGIIIKYSLVIFQTSKSLQKVYDKIFYENKTLSNLPGKPEIIFNSTNLQTGTLLTFSKKQIYDSSYPYKYFYSPQFQIDKIPISFAVAASTSFAPIFSPLRFKKEYLIDYDDIDEKKIKPELVDGGIFDNQGMYRLRKSADIIICSDASSPYDREKYSAINPFGLLMRTINILMKRIRAIQFQANIFENPDLSEIAYFSIDWQYEKCLEGFVAHLLNNKIRNNVLEYHSIPEDMKNNKDQNVNKEREIEIISYMKQKIGYDNIIKDSISIDKIKKIAGINTRLRGLKVEQIKDLVKHGETLAEIQIKLYCPSLLERR